MMGHGTNLTAKKYAQAFLNLFGTQLLPVDLEHISNAVNFFSKHRRVLFFLRFPAIDGAEKKRGLDFLCERFELPEAINELIRILLRDKRTFLLEQILTYICDLYNERNGIELFMSTSSHELSVQERPVVEQFLARQLGHVIICTYKVDKELIAGLRLQSDTHLWERSVAAQLRLMRLLVMH